MFRILSWLFRGSSSNDDGDEPEWRPAGRCGRAKDFPLYYPADHETFLPRLSVAGIHFRMKDALRFAHGQDQQIQLVREPHNPDDRNAIQVYGVYARGRKFIGYVPRDDAAYLARANMYDDLLPLLARIFEATTHDGEPFLDVTFQIMGPVARKAEFHAASKRRRRAKPAESP
jgi:hypothetical protein